MVPQRVPDEPPILQARARRRIGRAMVSRLSLALAVICGVGASFSASSAQGYKHYWSCDRTSYQQCYDYTGTRYNPWFWSHATMSATSDTICAKAVTAANNDRSPQACLNNSREVGACFSYNYPESWAYVYWGGAGTTRAINGDANTTSCS